MFDCAVCNVSVVEIGALISMWYLLSYAIYVGVSLLLRKLLGQTIMLSDNYPIRLAMLLVNTMAWWLVTGFFWYAYR